MSGADPIDGVDPDVLAGELALRVLSPQDEAAARARQSADPAFAADVEDWDRRIAGLIDEVAPVAPSPGVWTRIAARLGAAPANDNRRVGFWRAWALGSTGLLAASLAAVAVLAVREPETVVVQQPPEPGITRVATLTLESGGGVVTLAYDSQNGALVVVPSEPMATDARVPHLWLVMPDESVQLIGAMDGERASRRDLDSALAGQAGRAIAVAISMEAPGHTPGPNQPDGPVVASGQLQAL